MNLRFLPAFFSLLILSLLPGWFLPVATASVSASESTSAPAYPPPTVADQWARPSIGQSPNGVVYLRLDAGEGGGDRLIAVESPAAAKASLHETVISDGVVMMRPLDAIPLTPGAPVELTPGAAHIMLMGLKRPLKAGTVIELTLIFARAGRVRIMVPVQRSGP